MVTSVTTADECRQLVKSHVCDGNKMTELNENAYEFKGNPTQKGTWMQEVMDTKKNCETKKILLHRDCLTCPVMSPFGVLKNKMDETSVVSRDVTIIWETPILQKDENCKLKKVTSATGTMTKQDDGSFKLVDEINQLEFHYEDKTYEFCNHTFHKLANLKNAYIELPKIAKKEGMLLFNRQHGMCLSFQTLELDQCRPVEEQWYKISQTLVVQSFKDSSSCMGFVDHELQRTNERCDMQKLPYKGDLVRKTYRPKIVPLVWNPQTKALTDGVYCFEAYKDKRVEAAAMANNLPICSRLKPNGVHLIIQQFEAKNVTIRGQKPKCGFEPRFNNYTVGWDCYSLHPFQECFWKDQLINLNGHSYSWNSTSENYTRVYPTYHLATINLQQNFPDLDDNELEYQLLQHKAYETSEFEQKNVINELITRIHEDNGESMSEITLNKHVESRFWSLSN
ncbi:hypothetical protein DAPPUDRAFT_116854 [Daphnia pulex]|uniref:Uncharacterized protein n=1 Tax=Daphnia pulex TaxID=6669 RepID=E9HQR7_DAPPU|nr:hypothetical protein DAPPUDRAFT_116854 [Daphnia pulex]|eukprot:EFX65902.1 hypothetical protein DAPPUDRAFT_116854 [Daphnia pulex]